MNDEIKLIIDNLVAGKIILIRADDAWSLICDAENEKAIEKLQLIKKNQIDNPYVLLLDDDKKILKFVKEVPEIVWEVLDVSETPLTIIYPLGLNISEKILQDDGSIAIRILKDEFCKTIIKKYKKPILSTWACLDVSSVPLSFNKIDKNIIEKVDIIIRRENSIFNKPAGILKFGLNGEVQVIKI